MVDRRKERKKERDWKVWLAEKLKKKIEYTIETKAFKKTTAKMWQYILCDLFRNYCQYEKPFAEAKRLVSLSDVI